MKQLPNDIQSEQCLLGCMLIDDSIINLVDIDIEDFYDSNNRLLYKAIKSLKKHRKTVDIVLLKEFLEIHNQLDKVGGIIHLAELTEIVPTTSNWKEYRDIIKQKADRRKIITYGKEIEEMGYREEQEMDNILNKVENISDYIFDLKPKENIGDTNSYVNAFEDLRDKVNARGGMLGIPTIFPAIDKLTKGQQEGKVTTLVAYSNVGKSKVSYSYVSNFLKQGKKVMYISLEVDKAMLFSNIIANYYNKNYYDVLEEDFYYEMQDFEKLEIYDNLYKLQDIKNVIRSRMPDIVFIDFIQNIQASGTETEKMTTIAQELQQLAILSGVSIFNLSQANNDSRFKNGTDIQPKGSGAIFASTDIMFALHRENGQLYYTISKNKYGPAHKKFLMMPNETYTNFTITEAEDSIGLTS